MRRLILIIFFAGFLAPAALHAQKVYKEGDKVILDMTVGAGMPEGAVTSTPKSWSGNPSNDAGPLADNAPLGKINAKVYHKLEIAPHDINNLGVIGGTGNLAMNWATAFNRCKNSTYGEGGWRLPTQRELHMMWIFKPALETLGVTAFSSVGYWSSTEYNASFSWHVYFSYGNTDGTGKIGTLRVRCVREL